MVCLIEISRELVGGEDYLYPASYFVLIEVSQVLEESLLEAAASKRYAKRSNLLGFLESNGVLLQATQSVQRP